MLPRLLALTLTLVLPASVLAQQTPSAVIADPALDAANPAYTQAFQIPSHGDQLNALLYIAAGPGAHPTVILLHGFPGNERNLDLAQAIRRDGWNVLYFNYRGSWGTSGSFSFEHSMQDAASAIAYLRDPANAARLHVDPASLVLIGHSMGGMIAAYTGAHDSSIRAIGLISAANMSTGRLSALKPNETVDVTKLASLLDANGIYALAGCTAQGLAQELLANTSRWDFTNFTPLLTPRPILIITSDDHLAPPADLLASNLRSLHDPYVTTLHLATNHTYDSQRIALAVAVINWLNQLPK